MSSQKPLISKDVLEFGFCRLDGLGPPYKQDIKLLEKDTQIGRLLRGAVLALPEEVKQCISKFLKNKFSDRRYVAMCLLITLDEITKNISRACEITHEGLTTRQIASIFGEDEEKSDLYTAGALYDFFRTDREERKIANKYIDKKDNRALFATHKPSTAGSVWKVVNTTRDEFFKNEIKSIVIITHESLFKSIQEIPKLMDLIKLHRPNLSYINQDGSRIVDILFVTGVEIFHSRYLVDSGRPPVESFWGLKMTTTKFSV
jgi:hypothetical protein